MLFYRVQSIVDSDILLRSGSGDLWVGATNCKDQGNGQPCSAKHATLGKETSSSFVNTGKAFQVVYGSAYNLPFSKAG